MATYQEKVLKVIAQSEKGLITNSEMASEIMELSLQLLSDEGVFG